MHGKMLLTEKIKSTVRDVEGYPRPGIVFKDITPVLANAPLVREIIQEMVRRFAGIHVDVVAGIEARGFILGSLLAYELGCGFVPVRKTGRLPYKTARQRYDLEYGSSEIEVHTDSISPGASVLIHDDLLATGGTACAAGKLVQRLGGNPVGFSFLINLGFLPGAENIQEQFGVAPDFLIKY